jgi:hypothetical protein
MACGIGDALTCAAATTLIISCLPRSRLEVYGRAEAGPPGISPWWEQHTMADPAVAQEIKVGGVHD